MTLNLSKIKKSFIKKYLKRICYNKSKIGFADINSFNISTKAENDSKNTMRENIIGCIINNRIPEGYYNCSKKWWDLREQTKLYIDKLCKSKNITITSQECIHKAGRNNHNDFTFKINGDFEFAVEFKFNAECVIDTPQFVSPMKPSQYLDNSFEEFFYKNYLPLIAAEGNLNMPDKDQYLKTIHNNKVECMKEFKKKYDSDKTFNKFCKKTDKEAIKKFISETSLNLEKLSEKLRTSQKDKVYMCYKDGVLYYDKLNENLYKITKTIRREKTNYVCLTDCGMKIEVKLRFKNGCGIQFPAFQIKRKIPSVKELKVICKKNKIVSPKIKKDICKILDDNKIIY